MNEKIISILIIFVSSIVVSTIIVSLALIIYSQKNTSGVIIAGNQKIYNAKEIDNLMINKTSNIEVLNMLSKCDMYSTDTVCSYVNGKPICDPDSIFGDFLLDDNGLVVPDVLCKKIGQSCLIVLDKIQNQEHVESIELSSCSNKQDPIPLRMLCCSP